MEHRSKAENVFYAMQQQEKQKALTLIAKKHGMDNATLNETIAELYADLSSRIRVVEEYLIATGDNTKTRFSAVPSAMETGTEQIYKVAISDLHQAGLGPLYHNDQGLPYRYLSADTTLSLFLNIDRSQTQTLAMDIEKINDEKKLKQCELKIDGVLLRHKLKTINGQRRLLCYIPPSKSANPTYFEFKAPEGANAANFQLAISDIYCVPKLRLLQFAKKLFAR